MQAKQNRGEIMVLEGKPKAGAHVLRCAPSAFAMRAALACRGAEMSGSAPQKWRSSSLVLSASSRSRSCGGERKSVPQGMLPAM